MKTILSIIILLAVCVPASAGEWMFRLCDAHVQLRQALFDRDASAVWEHVDRSTRQQSGMLAAQIRRDFDSLPDHQKAALRRALGLADDQMIRKISASDLLVAPFFIKAHPELLVGDRDDTRLKDHGRRMAGPTGMVVHKGTVSAKTVPYRFTTEGHFGGQAMDYRAQLSVPALVEILGTARPPAKLTDEVKAKKAIIVFQEAQQAFAKKDADRFWSLLDCDSQSQAAHFADQAQDRGSKPAHKADILERLSLSETELNDLDGKQVWWLPWSVAELAYFVNGTNPRYVTAKDHDKSRVAIPTGYRRRDRPNPEAMIEFESGGKTWQVPARINYRDGSGEVKLFLRPPFYLRLRA